MPTLRHLLLPLLLAPLFAAAEPRWSVQTTPGLFDSNEEDGIDDCNMLTYLISNTSTPGDANNLVTFAVPAGSNHGVYLAAAPEGWNTEILPDRTIFRGNGNYIPPNSSSDFYLYSTLIGVNTNAWAEGDARGPPDDQDFPPVRVSVPAALPPRLTALAPAANGVWLALSDLVVPRSSNTVQFAASPTGAWHATACFVGTAPATNLWLPGRTSRAFFRVTSRQW